MKITCTGMLRGLTVVGAYDDDGDPSPELQLWRPTNDTLYERVADVSYFFPNVCPSTNTLCTENKVYQWLLPDPIPVIANDIIGIILPRNRDNNIVSFRMRFLMNSSHTSYVLGSITNIAFSDEFPEIIHNNYQPVLSLDGTFLLVVYYIATCINICIYIYIIICNIISYIV